VQPSPRPRSPQGMWLGSEESWKLGTPHGLAVRRGCGAWPEKEKQRGESRTRWFDIALPVLAGEHRAAMLIPAGGESR
jgi:hypothetical protein